MGEWISDIQLYDIEHSKIYQTKDQLLKNIPVPLVEPSMSAEHFDTVGLIICGVNPQNKKTEVHIYSP